jgi:hypothetical protein
VNALGGEYVPTDQLDQRGQIRGAGADSIGQGRHVEIDALPGLALALPIERLVFAELGNKGLSLEGLLRLVLGQ